MKHTMFLVLVLAACSKGGATQAAPELAAVNGPYAAEFPGFDATAVAKKLQGTWVFKGNMDRPTIWSIAGTKVTQVDHEGKETTGTLEVSSPCKLAMNLGPDEGAQPLGFAFVGDAVHLGLGSSGAIVGKTMYVCDYPSLFRKTGDTCELQSGNKSENGKLSYLWHPIHCNTDATSFAAKNQFDHDVALQIDGNALYDDQMKKNVATKVTDIAAGKAKQAEIAKK